MIKKNRTSRLLLLILKFAALLMGYALWYVFSQNQTIFITRAIPLCFDNMPSNRSINGPESVNITLSGTRSDFKNINIMALAVHINAQSLKQEQTTITLRPSHLFLPNRILLVHYDPAPIVITMIEENNINQEQQGAN